MALPGRRGVAHGRGRRGAGRSGRSVRVYGRRLGLHVVPLGVAFSTEEAVLLAENGDIFFGGDAGMQRVAHGLDTAVEALVTDDWDKTFF
ncbi:SUKH-3 domain-containing protein [Streptomyces boluensis]|uniref:SUKH-3 domain-containing protein n=1 Tax=Streptomyces boluensis TaxID=1775135 RepID=UPI0035E4182C